MNNNMNNKNVSKIFYGTVAIIILGCAFYVYKNQNRTGEDEKWKTYTNEEFNFETKVPEGVEVEIEE